MAHEDKCRPIATWRRPIGKKVRKIYDYDDDDDYSDDVDKLSKAI